MLRINDVVMYLDTRYRILVVSDTQYTWIDIDSDKAFPEQIPLSEVDAEILSEALRKVEDPFLHLAAQLPEQGSTAQKVRDKRLAAIEMLINHPDIYYRTGRNALIQQAIEAS